MVKDISILIGGEAGQGIQTIGSLLSQVCHKAGFYIYSTDDFQSRIRGGHSYHLLRVSNQPVSAPRLKPDIVVAIDKNSLNLHADRVKQDGIVLSGYENETMRDINVHYFPFKQMAKEAGGVIALNTVAAGVVLAVLGADFSIFSTVLSEIFQNRGDSILKLNLEAGRKGIESGMDIGFSHHLDFSEKIHPHKIMSGAKAAALGALAADCRFFPFYPMSPGTPIISNVIGIAEQLPVVVEQAEDELAAINMAIGASFAGVRSLTATSGGGFSLMTEGLGLAAMTETPVVIINAQRPGPATGLATRTAQADLLFTIHASQDEFPRFVFAPGGILETFKTVKRAFYLSEKYQVPSIMLMDQFLVDSSRTEPDEFTIGNEYLSYIDQSDTDTDTGPYLRYELTGTGVSKRRVPCASHALVRSPGNEHTPEGFTTEDPEIRNLMVKKRFKKLKYMKQEMRQPSVFCQDSKFFLVGWGSSKGSIMEACLHLREEGFDAGWIIFEDLWPLDEKKLSHLFENKKMIMVEGNHTSQLGMLIRQVTGRDYHASILKYDGRPIFPEYIADRIKKIIGN